jgi:hypothetical protein
LKYVSGFPLMWTLLFLIHGFYYDLTNVTKLKIQFNTITWTLCGIFFSPIMCHSLVHMPIEHFSKWLELVPLLDHISEGVAYAFLDRVLNRFGAPFKVLID